MFSEGADAGVFSAAMLQEIYKVPRLPEVFCKTDNASQVKKKFNSANLVSDWCLRVDVINFFLFSLNLSSLQEDTSLSYLTLHLFIWLTPLFCNHQFSNKYGIQLNMCCVSGCSIKKLIQMSKNKLWLTCTITLNLYVPNRNYFKLFLLMQ